MTGRTCKRCGEKAVHRTHRAQWMRLLSYLVPIRPMQCHACRARSWVLMTRDRDAWQSWLVSGVLWISLLSLVLGTGMQPEAGKAEAGAGLQQAGAGGEVVAPPEAEPQSEPQTESQTEPVTNAAPPPAGPAPSADSSTQVAQVARGIETAEFAEPSPPAPKPGPVDSARQRHVLQAVESSVSGKTLRVLLRASHAPFTFTRFESKAASGHVLDLPGNWQFVDGMKMLHAFPESNLQQIRFGLHKKFLRVVLTLRRPDGAAEPRITATPEGLLIEIDG